jgi:glycosyltransferase involved in cell wall biosynthesis
MTRIIQETTDNSDHIMISGLAYDHGKSGIAEYTNQLTRALCKHQPVTITLLKCDLKTFPVRSDKLSIIVISNFFSGPIMNILWHIFVLPYILLKSECGVLLLPAVNRRLGLWFPKPVIGIVHDLSQYSVPSKYNAPRTIYVKFFLPLAISNLKHIIAISKNTKKDLTRYWKVEASKISVCYNGYDKARYNTNTPDNVSDIIASYDLKKPYLLYVSRIEHPGKNHVRLIEAFEALPDAHGKDLNLVFAGSDWNGAEQVKKLAHKSKRANQIHFLGFVPSAHLPALYHEAKMSVFPSLYEGFGIPLVESMACGTPCLCSNNSSLGEIAGNAALTFDPKENKDIYQSLLLALKKPEILKKYAERGVIHCQQFSWNNLAQHIQNMTYPEHSKRDINYSNTNSAVTNINYYRTANKSK